MTNKYVNNLDSIIKLIQENETVAKQFHKVETKILSILNFKDFFEVLLTEIQKTFNIPYVWFSIIESDELANLVTPLLYSEVLIKKINIIKKTDFEGIIKNRSEPILISNDLKACHNLFPPHNEYKNLMSIAIVPITIDGQLIGSLNQADISPLRFRTDMDSSLLEQLGVKLSLCLSNVTAHEKLKFLSYHDPLTKLLNRRIMETVLKREFNRAKRYASPLSIVFLNIDNFKRANESYGHKTSDSILKYIAVKLEDQSRESDIVARFTEDEFVLILPETTSENTKKIINRHKIYFLEHPFKFEKNSEEIAMPVSFSFGIASTEDKTIKNAKELLKKAHSNLYKIKKSKTQSNLTNIDNEKPSNIIDINFSRLITKNNN